MDRLWAWDRPTSVRDVFEDLHRHRSVAYTTVMTVMNNLHKKGVLTRETSGRAYIYRPARSREEHIGDLLEDALGESSDRTAALSVSGGHTTRWPGSWSWSPTPPPPGRCDSRVLAGALVVLATDSRSEVPATAFAAGGPAVAVRVTRLLGSELPLGRPAVAGSLLAFLLPLAVPLLALSPALAGAGDLLSHCPFV
jgi:Penicillinase repressor